VLATRPPIAEEVTASQDAVVVYLSRTIILPPASLLVVTRDFLCAAVSYLARIGFCGATAQVI